MTTAVSPLMEPLPGGHLQDDPERCTPRQKKHASNFSGRLLKANVHGMIERVDAMKKVLTEDADSFGRRAELMYEQRPEILSLMDDLLAKYQSLAEKFDLVVGPRTGSGDFLFGSMNGGGAGLLLSESDVDSGLSISGALMRDGARRRKGGTMKDQDVCAIEAEGLKRDKDMDGAFPVIEEGQRVAVALDAVERWIGGVKSGSIGLSAQGKLERSECDLEGEGFEAMVQQLDEVKKELRGLWKISKENKELKEQLRRAEEVERATVGMGGKEESGQCDQMSAEVTECVCEVEMRQLRMKNTDLSLRLERMEKESREVRERQVGKGSLEHHRYQERVGKDADAKANCLTRNDMNRTEMAGKVGIDVEKKIEDDYEEASLQTPHWGRRMKKADRREEVNEKVNEDQDEGNRGKKNLGREVECEEWKGTVVKNDYVIGLEVEIGQLKIKNTDLKVKMERLQRDLREAREKGEEIAEALKSAKRESVGREEFERVREELKAAQERNMQMEAERRESGRARERESADSAVAMDVEIGKLRIKNMDLKNQVERLQAQLKGVKDKWGVEVEGLSSGENSPRAGVVGMSFGGMESPRASAVAALRMGKREGKHGSGGYEMWKAKEEMVLAQKTKAAAEKEVEDLQHELEKERGERLAAVRRLAFLEGELKDMIIKREGNGQGARGYVEHGMNVDVEKLKEVLIEDMQSENKTRGLHEIKESTEWKSKTSTANEVGQEFDMTISAEKDEIVTNGSYGCNKERLEVVLEERKGKGVHMEGSNGDGILCKKMVEKIRLLSQENRTLRDQLEDLVELKNLTITKLSQFFMVSDNEKKQLSSLVCMTDTMQGEKDSSFLSCLFKSNGLAALSSQGPTRLM